MREWWGEPLTKKTNQHEKTAAELPEFKLQTSGGLISFKVLFQTTKGRTILSCWEKQWSSNRLRLFFFWSGFVQLTQKLQDYLLLQLLLPHGCQAVFFRRVALAKTVKESSVNAGKSIQKLFKNPEKSPLVQTWRRNPARLVSFRNFFTTKKIFSWCLSEQKCEKLLRNIHKNPPNNNTLIDINIKLSKARYRCRDGFKLVGQKIRSCKKGKWKEKQEPRCLGIT